MKLWDPLNFDIKGWKVTRKRHASLGRKIEVDIL
jgi:hypothetical protein